MLQAFLVLTPKPGKMDALIAEYKRAGIIDAGIPYGLQRGQAVVIPASDEEPEHLVITSAWADQASYDSWLAAPERVSVTTGVWPLLASGQADAVHKVTRDALDPDAPLPLGPLFAQDSTRKDPVITVEA